MMRSKFGSVKTWIRQHNASDRMRATLHSTDDDSNLTRPDSYISIDMLADWSYSISGIKGDESNLKQVILHGSDLDGSHSYCNVNDQMSEIRDSIMHDIQQVKHL